MDASGNGRGRDQGFGLDAVAAALAAGLTDLGENRVQEAIEKIDASSGARWHMIGHLQRNKARHIPGRFVLVHSVDSEPLAAELSGTPPSRSGALRVLVQVNVAGKRKRAAATRRSAPGLARAVAGQPHLEARGPHDGGAAH